MICSAGASIDELLGRAGIAASAFVGCWARQQNNQICDDGHIIKPSLASENQPIIYFYNKRQVMLWHFLGPYSYAAHDLRNIAWYQEHALSRHQK